MADRYMVGNNSPKDIYTVGASGKDKYNVGGTKPVNVSQAKNSQLSGGDQDGVVGSKSAFNYPKDNPSTYKDIGDRSDNMNFGGNISDGISKIPLGPNGEVELSFSQKGDFNMEKDAMARRKGIMDQLKPASQRDQDMMSPVVDSYPMKK